MTDKVIYAMYDDDDVTKDACQTLVDNGVHVADVFSPFPIHGIDPIIGVKHTRLGIAAFMYGITGLLLAIIATRYFMVTDWHGINIGGKPNFTFYHNLPSFVPIMFECTVLFAAHLMSITYLFRNKLYPGASTTSPDPRTTDDRFVIELNVNDNEGHSIDELIDLVKKTGIIEFEEKLIK